MNSIRIELNELAPFETKAHLDIYLCEDSWEYSYHERPMIVICPGGGYSLTSDREAEPVARVFAARGYHTAVLRYTCRYEDGSPIAPKQLYEAAIAVRFLREHAEEYKIIPDNIAISGYSAGGHVAGTLSCMWNDESIPQKLGFDNELCRPNASILCYPVTTGDRTCTHSGSFENLLGNTDNESNRSFWSLENRLGEQNPPTFIWSTADDGCVPIENSIRYASGLAKHGINFELHIFPHGVHGLSTAGGETYVSRVFPVDRWVGLVGDWLTSIFKF